MSRRLAIAIGGLVVLVLLALALLRLARPGPVQLPPETIALTPSPAAASPATLDSAGRDTQNLNAQDPQAAVREAMVRDQIEQRGVADPAVLAVMRRVPRDKFVPSDYLPLAYGDHPLPIGYGQTISQPYIVALMTEALAVKPGDRVLEVGTGSGYQAAVLAELQAEVYTMEIVPELARQAAERLAALGYANVQVQQADGYFGWAEHAPYDAIIVTAAPDHVPQSLVTQLKEGGRLVVPVGPQGAVQTLWLFVKQGGELQAKNLGAVSFVPLTGGPR